MSAGNWGGFVDLTLSSGGLIRLPYTFVLIDPAPEASFSLPNGTRTNESVPISMYAYDRGTGFNISDLNLDADIAWTYPINGVNVCLLYTSPSPRDVEESRMPSSA